MYGLHSWKQKLEVQSLEDRCLLSFGGSIPLLTPDAAPVGITTGPDGALWFAERDANQIGRLAPDGAMKEFGLPTPGSQPQRITTGPDGALWFTEPGSNHIGRMTVDGAVQEYGIPTPGSDPEGITAGPDGAVWFTEQAVDQIGRITPDGTITEYAAPWGRANPSGFHGIAAGKDGALWFTEETASAIGRVTPDGTFTEYALPSGGAPLAITAGPDGALWFTENPTQIGRISTDGTVTELEQVHALNTFYGDITAGSDGALWFLVNNTIGSPQLGRITPAGDETFYEISAPYGLGGITTGPDGNIWFTETGGNAIGQWVLTGPGAAPPVGGSPQASFQNPAVDTVPAGAALGGDFVGQSPPQTVTLAPGAQAELVGAWPAWEVSLNEALGLPDLLV